VGAVSGALFDTHALVWALTLPERLGARARELVEDPSVVLWVSAASAWEIATKHRLGKMPEAQGVLAGWDRQIDRLGARELPMSSAHARLAGALDWHHRDPFDRLLVAQASLEGLPILTRDPQIAAYPQATAIW
jgi:PIN domain nuclease of toxin-antitoxin system